ncbi:CRAL-TRIO domain-containing protein [Sparassis latifolia]
MPSSQQESDAILVQFREQLVQEDLLHEGDTIGTDDGTLLRFLVARDFDLKQALAMWQNCVQWRKAVGGVGIDELYRRMDRLDYPERDHVLQYWPSSFHKTDKKGRPLNFQYYGGINMPELYKGISPERLWEYVVVSAESLPRECIPIAERVSGTPNLGHHCIVDLKDFGLSQFWQMKNFCRDGFAMTQNYYPELMSKLSVVNAPTSFTFIWSLVKPWLSPVTQSKVEILGANFREVLLEQIPAENLPEQLGGCMKSNAGAWLEGWKERRALLQGEKHLKEDSSFAEGEMDDKATYTVDVAPLAAPEAGGGMMLPA